MSSLASSFCDLADFGLSRQIFREIVMPIKQLSILGKLAAVTETLTGDWEDLDGPDSRVGVDYWYRNRKSGTEAYLNLDQDYLTISVDGERLYDGPHSSPS